MLSDIRAVLDQAGRQLTAIEATYEESLQAHGVSNSLRVQIKSVLEHQRAALDYLGHEIQERYGAPGKPSYYPLARSSQAFLSLIDRQLPGVRQGRPDISRAIELRQPYQQGYEWLGHLATLSNENKHERLTPQTRQETRRVRAANPGTGSVEYTPWEPARGGVKFGSGVSIGGVPVDPRTQRPVPTAWQTVTETVYVDWHFVDPPRSVLGTLKTIQAGLPDVIGSVSSVVGF